MKLLRTLVGIDNWNSEAGSEMSGSKIAENEVDAHKTGRVKVG